MLHSTPLHIAAYRGDIELVQLLLKEKVDVNAVDCYEKTPLHYAAKKGHKEVVEALLDAEGINVNVVDDDRWTPLHYAADRGHIEVVNALVAAKGIDVNAIDKDGWTPLYHAVHKGRTEVINTLFITKGVDVNVIEEKINHSASKLFRAVFTNKKEEAESIIESSKKECNLAAILQSDSGMERLFRSKEEAEELAKKDNKDIIEEIRQRQERQAIFKGVAVGILAGLIGSTITIALFVSDVIEVEPHLTLAAIAIVAVFTAGIVAYVLSKPQKPEPNTKMKGQNNVDQHVPKGEQIEVY